MGISYNVDESKLTLEERENKKKDNFYIITILGKLRYNKNFKNKLNADEKSWLLNNKSKNAQKLRDIVDTAIADEDAFWEVFSTSQLSNFIEDICRLYGKTKNNWRKYKKINNIPKEYDFQNPFTAALKAYKQDENTPVVEYSFNNSPYKSVEPFMRSSSDNFDILYTISPAFGIIQEKEVIEFLSKLINSKTLSIKPNSGSQAYTIDVTGLKEAMQKTDFSGTLLEKYKSQILK